MSTTLYVTAAGSVKLGSDLYIPGDPIPIEKFIGKESSLRELVADGKLSQRKRRMQVDGKGRVVKNRSSEMPPLPSEIDDHKQPALQSKDPGASKVAGELADLKHERMEKARQEEADAAAAAVVAEVPVKSEVAPVPEAEEIENLSNIADSASEDDGDDEFFQDEADDADAKLLQELSEKED